MCWQITRKNAAKVNNMNHFDDVPDLVIWNRWLLKKLTWTYVVLSERRYWSAPSLQDMTLLKQFPISPVKLLGKHDKVLAIDRRAVMWDHQKLIDTYMLPWTEHSDSYKISRCRRYNICGVVKKFQLNKNTNGFFP